MLSRVQQFPYFGLNFPLTPYGTLDSSPAGCGRAMWQERSDPARQAQPAKVLGPKLSFFFQMLAQLFVQPSSPLNFKENISAQNNEVG